MTALRLPGLIDVHVHLREPGGEHKEDLTSGTAAALAGGVTMVLDMPNNNPPVIDAGTLASKRRAAGRKALCDVGFYAGATVANAAEVAGLADEAAGLKIYLDQTYGPLRIHDPSGGGNGLAALLSHFRTWPANRPIAVHAEGLSMAMAIGLARSFGRKLHLCHVSLASEIALIRAAKRSGAALSCEVTPHHLFLTEKDAQRLGPLGHMKPPLASAADVAALWDNLDVVDCIATDHAPHTRAEKEGASPPPGVPGLETTLPLLWTAVVEGRLSQARLVELVHDSPRRIFDLPIQSDTWIEIDPEARYTLGSQDLHTRCGWTPFEGVPVQGRVRRVTLRGQTAVEDGHITVQPGFGRPVAPLPPAGIAH
ncbi:MAG: amidohydrolase family protein [Anaerolineae bacterium]|jgi:carbamoyl-phosphate synthase/aspartate carbamoyltransferase/dihydroorotase